MLYEVITISKLNIRSSIYDVTNRCNLRCKGCFFFSSGEHEAAREQMDISEWEAFIDREKERGVNLAILIGGEPTLCLDRVERACVAFLESGVLPGLSAREIQEAGMSTTKIGDAVADWVARV